MFWPPPQSMKESATENTTGIIVKTRKPMKFGARNE